jgi:Holliday junction DNA helicase RuvA
VIASLNGRLLFRSADSLILDVGGVGYKVFVSQQTSARLPSIGEKLFLFIHTAVREDDLSLFGFLDENEKRVFQRLITVNGIGPKLALTILSGINFQELVQAVRREDLVRLTAIPGIGKKTAERIIVDLKDKLQEFLAEGAAPIPAADGRRKTFDEAVSALVNLGYTRSVAERTLSQVPLQEESSLESVLRQALKILSEVRA